MKTRKFAGGGKPEGGRFDEDTYSRARRFVESGGEKEETKTAVKKARKVEVKPAKEKSRAPAQPTKAEEKNERVGPTVQRAEKQAADKDKLEAEYAEKTRPGRDAIENVYPEALMLGGAGVRGLMGRKGAAEAAGSAERGLATSTTPISYLGRSGAKNITPTERLAGRQEPRLEFGAAKIGRDGEGVGKLTQGAPKPAAPSQITNSKAGGKNLTDEVLDILRGPNSAKKKPTSFKEDEVGVEFKRGGKVKKYAKGGSIDGIAQRGKTNCKMR